MPNKEPLGPTRANPKNPYQTRHSGPTLLKRRIGAEQARWDAVALLVARLQDDIERATIRGGSGPQYGRATQALLGDMLSEPERLGSCVLSLLQIVHTLTSQANVGGYPAFVDYMVNSIPED